MVFRNEEEKRPKKLDQEHVNDLEASCLKESNCQKISANRLPLSNVLFWASQFLRSTHSDP